jgi:hypothetical protein
MENQNGSEPAFGGLTPQEAGRLGGKASGNSRKARKDFDWLRQEADKLLPVLVKAAQGDGVFADLPPVQRLAALKLVLEYAYGKPAQRKQVDTPEEEEETFSIGIHGDE